MAHSRNQETESSSGEDTAATTSSSSTTTTTTQSGGNSSYTNVSNFNYYKRLTFLPPKESPKERLEKLMGRAFSYNDKASVFEEIIKLIDQFPDLKNHPSENYRCTVLELAATLGQSCNLETQIEKLFSRNCTIGSKYLDFLPNNLRPNSGIERAKTLGYGS